MCSAETFRPIVKPVAQFTGADKALEATTGKSLTDTLTPKDKIRQPLVRQNTPYKGLAIGTQTGGTRKPLGSSSSGLNR